MKKWICAVSIVAVIVTSVQLGGVAAIKALPQPFANKDGKTVAADLTLRDFNMGVAPETFAITMTQAGQTLRVSEPLKRMTVTHLKKTQDLVSWTYPEMGLDVAVSKVTSPQPHIDVDVHATKVAALNWPVLKGDAYVLPLYEGKYIPAKDENWKQFLNGKVMTVSESLSMGFLSKIHGQTSLVYVMTNLCNNDLGFDGPSAGGDVLPNITHEFPATDKEKHYGYRIYMTSSDPQAIAHAYKTDVLAHGGIVTLEEKAASNPEIRKLYGAPQIYLWNHETISQDDVLWQAMSKWKPNATAQAFEAYVAKFTEGGSTAIKELGKVRQQGYADRYQKSCITEAMNNALLKEDLYKVCMGPTADGAVVSAITENRIRRSHENKLLFAKAYGDALKPMKQWGNGNALSLVEDFKKSGMDKAWLCFSDWIPGMINPEFVKTAVRNGYLIAPYDSYDSIHKEGGDDWITSSFTDQSLFEKATIANKRGRKITGFNQVGRALNTTLSMPSVKERVTSIIETGVGYNSWFIDCDAAGNLRDDYSPEHMTSQKQDMEACLERMAYIRDQKHMVIGSEQGNDYASKTIAFAQGIETPVICWEDKDIRVNKASPYYTGGYWSPGGVPPIFSKVVPIKPLYEQVYLSPAYALPLFKMVYNDSVITTHHWEWGSFKIKGQDQNRMLNDMLYNVPPLYHLDKASWQRDKTRIMAHLKVWSPFHEKAVLSPMTDFAILTKDRMVQTSRYGNLQVVANFSNKTYNYQGTSIKGKSVLILDGTHKTIYTPK